MILALISSYEPINPNLPSIYVENCIEMILRETKITSSQRKDRVIGSQLLFFFLD